MKKDITAFSMLLTFTYASTHTLIIPTYLFKKKPLENRD